MWDEAGVWDSSTGELLDPQRLQCQDWMEECFAPFVHSYAEAIRKEMPHAIIAVCPPAFGSESQRPFPGQLPEASIWAPHFYDGVVLVAKVWNPGFGIEEVPPGEQLLGGLLPLPPIRPVFGLTDRIESYKRQMRRKAELAGTKVPALLGEVGVPFDLGGSVGALREAKFEAVSEAIDAHMKALEELFLPFCWWNYTPENSHERGDGWNGENLSIFCPESGGGRCLNTLVRPALARCAGEPMSQVFELGAGRYFCEYNAQAADVESVFFVPRLHFSLKSTEVLVTPGVKVTWDEATQQLHCRPGRTGPVKLELRRKV